MADTRPTPTLSLRIRFGGDDMMGPGKAELLETIAATGSIAAAALAMGMSYKRAWMLVETLNAMFDAPVVESSRGGQGKGGAVLTGRGQAVLSCYREIEAVAQERACDHLEQLRGWLRDGTGPQRQED